jgi:hypothetical protein
MAETFKKLAQAQAGTSAATLYTSPATAGNSTIIKSIRIVNTDTSARWVKLYQAGTADSNLILPQTTIPAGGWAEFNGSIVMSNNETLSSQAEVASKVTITVSGVEIT